MGCSTPGCPEVHGELYIHGGCHTGAGTYAAYAGGVLTITCRACRAEICRIAVARDLP